MPKAQTKTSQTPLTETSSSVKVMKDLNAEELQVLSGISSSIQQLMAMAGSGASQAPVADGAGGTPGYATMQAEEEEEDEDEEDHTEPDGDEVKPPSTVVKGKARKAIIQGDPDASVANDPAEERVDDVPEWDEDNLDTITKAVLRMVGGARIKKSQKQNPIVVALAQVSKALNQVAREQSEVRGVVNDILEGLGVAKSLDEQAAAQPRKVQKSGPIQTMPQDRENVLNEFLAGIQKAMKGGGANEVGNVGDATLSPKEAVQKNLSSIALALRQEAGDLWQ